MIKNPFKKLSSKATSGQKIDFLSTKFAIHIICLHLISFQFTGNNM